MIQTKGNKQTQKKWVIRLWDVSVTVEKVYWLGTVDTWGHGFLCSTCR